MSRAESSGITEMEVVAAQKAWSDGIIDIGAVMTNAALRTSLPGAAAKMEKKVEARVAPKDEATRDAPAAEKACGCAVA